MLEWRYFFDVNLTLLACLCSNIGTRAKIDALRSAISMHAPALPKGLCKRADKILLEIAALSSEWRNTLAHGFPADIEFEKGTFEWHWARQSARRQLDFSILEMDPAHWRDATKQVKSAGKKWCSAYQAIWHKLAKLTPAERDKLYSPEIRYR